jgi:hypothetical protein
VIPGSERKTTLTLVSGAVYDFKGVLGEKGVVIYPPGPYRVHGVAHHTRNFQEVVVYEGLEGRETGRLYCCPIADFSERFTPRPAEGEEPPTETPKVPFIGNLRPVKVFGVPEGTGI